jgi:hypothetical protein
LTYKILGSLIRICQHIHIICQHIVIRTGGGLKIQVKSDTLEFLGFLGVFVPAKDLKGNYLMNWWGEMMFSVPDGMHRCVELVFLLFLVKHNYVLTLSKVKAYCEDPTLAEEHFACRGRFLNIDISTEKGQEKCVSIGSVANQTSSVVAKESLGTKIKLLIEVFFSYIFFCFLITM